MKKTLSNTNTLDLPGTADSNEDWQRLLEIISYFNVRSVCAFSIKIGLPRSENLYQIKKGNHGISKSLAEKICRVYPEVRKAWVLTGDGYMLQSGPTELISQITKIPFFEKLSGFISKSKIPDRMLYISKEFARPCDAASRYEADELIPLFRKYEVIGLKECNPNGVIIFGEAYLIQTVDYIHCRIIRRGLSEEELCLCACYQAEYDVIKIHKSDIKALYHVTTLMI